MAIVTYPLNNINYSAEDAELFHCTRTSGVFAADEDFLASVTGADNIVTIGQGIAWIRNSRFAGKVVANKEAVSVDMGLADGTYDRIDAVVLRFDANNNQSNIISKQGVASSSPVAPEVVRTETLYELHLYHVRRRAGATSILSSDITDLRADSNYCGVMSDDVTNLGDDYVSKGQIGVAGGVASLDTSGKIPSRQLPSMNYIPTSQKGVASGVATLDTSGKVPSGQLPVEIDTGEVFVRANSKSVTSIQKRWTRIGKTVFVCVEFELLNDADQSLLIHLYNLPSGATAPKNYVVLSAEWTYIGQRSYVSSAFGELDITVNGVNDEKSGANLSLFFTMNYAG